MSARSAAADTSGRRLAAPRLADEADRLPGEDVERHVRHGLHLGDLAAGSPPRTEKFLTRSRTDISGAGVVACSAPAVSTASSTIRPRSPRRARRLSPRRPPRETRRHRSCPSLRRSGTPSSAPSGDDAQHRHLLRQRSRAKSHRGWKAHPDGGLSSEGGEPRIGRSRSTRSSSRGIDASRPRV